MRTLGTFLVSQNIIIIHTISKSVQRPVVATSPLSPRHYVRRAMAIGAVKSVSFEEKKQLDLKLV